MIRALANLTRHGRWGVAGQADVWPLHTLGLPEGIDATERALSARLIDELDLGTGEFNAVPVVRDPTVLVMDLDEATTQWVVAGVPDVNVLRAPSESRAMEVVRDVDAILGWVTPRVVDAADRLAWIQSYTAGVESLLTLSKVRDGHIAISSMRGVAAPVIAEHALALGLTLARRTSVPTWATVFRSSDRIAPVQTFEGQHALVAGLGSIGGTLARKLLSLGVQVSVCRNRSAVSQASYTDVFGLTDLHQKLPAFDMVFNTLPLTPQTHHVFDAAAFGCMRRGALFINVGRGGTVDSNALAHALQDGTVGGAGLDVTFPEPLPRFHPLRSAPNLIITPHMAGRSAATRRRELMLLRVNLQRFLGGAPLLGRVDPAVGY